MPFGPRLLEQPAGTGLTLAGWTADYRIAVLDSSGDTVRVVGRDRPQVSIREQEWQEAQREYLKFRETWPDAECTSKTMERPDRKSSFRNLMLDTSGRLWVEAYTPTGTVWDVFDARGFLRGSVPGFSYLEGVPISIRGNLVAWVDADSLGVERVTVARVQVPPP